MINLEKELQKATVVKQKEAQQFEGIKEVKLLLQATDNREQELLRSFNLNDTLVQVEENRGKQIQLEKITAEFGASYHIEDIRELASNYNLRFLPLELYNGGIDSQLATKMLQFIDKHDLDARAIAHSDSFYILAPCEDFKLQTNVHEKPAPRPIYMNDPLLFYKSDRNEEVWTFVHKWGSEFTPVRLLTSMKYHSSLGYFTSKFLVAFVIAAFAIPAFGLFLTSSLITSVFACTIVGILYAGIFTIRRAGGTHENFDNYFSKDAYRSKKSRIHVFK